MANALAAVGIRVTANAVGPMRADVGLNQHLIWITTRPLKWTISGTSMVRMSRARKDKPVGEAHWWDRKQL